MSRILIIDKCNQCTYFERNMYHGECCWHLKVCKPYEDGRIPRKIESKYNKEKPWDWEVNIPKWCPLEEV